MVLAGGGGTNDEFGALIALCRRCGALELWLEVRDSNVRARSIYAHLGFAQDCAEPDAAAAEGNMAGAQ